jgi:DNA adenine methylase
MQYLGGKSRISNDISKIINQYSADKIFVSLFCGTCAIEAKIIAKEKFCNDSQEYLIKLFDAVQSGYELPDIVTKDDYNYCKSHKDENKVLTGFIGFGCSFGGKWFGGYAKNNSGTNYAKQSKNSLIKKMEGLKNVKFLNLDYRIVKIPDGSIVYCDPPYKGTTRYSNSNNFDHDEFWEYMRLISKNNNVFISEINAPDDFISIWEKPFKRVLDVNKDNIFNSIEKLFVMK